MVTPRARPDAELLDTVAKAALGLDVGHVSHAVPCVNVHDEVAARAKKTALRQECAEHKLRVALLSAREAGTRGARRR